MGYGNLRSVFSFPHPVNDVAARIVASMVLLVATAAVVFDIPWLIFFLFYGFLARVLTGPTLSPMGLIATRVSAATRQSATSGSRAS
jgi:hypothetical protein